MKVEIDVEIPDGYEATGEYRYARKGDIYLNNNNAVRTWDDIVPTTSPWLILREKPLRYEDFRQSSHGLHVVVDGGGDVLIANKLCVTERHARHLAGVLIAAADHVDRVKAHDRAKAQEARA